jgi:Heterokaryon incompatibility protein (HET)
MNCQRNHDLCRNLTSTNHPMPTRLVDVGLSVMNKHVRLCRSSGVPAGTPYVTLSHRWGSKQLFCLRKENRLSLEKKIPVSKLPKVFRNAIRFTRRIGIRYLWIDSLCIIQDSQTDRTHEAASMSTVYANGVCNLAATGFIDGTMGLFAARQPSLLQPILVNFNNEIYFDEGLAFR